MKQMNVELERRIRDIIKNDFGFGNQNIGSREIYDRLIEAGVEVPNMAMCTVLDKLRNEGLIKGPRYHNSEAVQKHGAYSIMWVSRYI
jgi:hypothetical protein